MALTQLERCWEEEVSHKVGRYHDYITRIILLRFVILELAFVFISIPRRVKKRPHSSIEVEKRKKKGHTAFSGLLSDNSFSPSDSDTNPNGILGCSRKQRLFSHLLCSGNCELCLL